jgi:hypothetical protein
LAGRTNITVVVGVVNEVVSGKILAGYISKSSLSNTALDIIIIKLFEIVFVAIARIGHCC